MDNLTHSLVGVLLARAGLDRLTPHATALCVIAANAPDIDIFAGVDPETYLVYHRHLTHSLFMIPVMAAVSVALTLAWAWLRRRIGRKPPNEAEARFVRMWAVALIPALSHPLLDLMNSYGIRLWLPFSAHWSRLDLLFIIDLVVWALLLAGVLATWALRRKDLRARASLVTLGAFLAYIASAALLHAHIVERLAQRTFDGKKPLEVAAFPAPFGPLSWSAYVRTDDFELWLPVDFLHLDELDTSAGRKFHAPRQDAATEAAWNTELGRAYRQFTQFPLEIRDSTPHGETIMLGDFRFVRQRRPGFLCIMQLDQALRVVSTQFDF